MNQPFSVRRILIFWLAFLSCWGQPNSIHHVLPVYTPIILLLAIFSAIYSMAKRSERRLRGPIDLCLEICLGLFVILAAISLVYSRDPLFGINLYASALIKIIIFLVLLRLNRGEVRSIKVFVTAVLVCASIFSLTGIALPIGIVFFGLEPLSRIETVPIGGNLDYDEMLAFYGIGFVRAATTLFDVFVPRAQSFFSEPGYLAFFLEFSIFTTVYAAASGALGFDSKKLKWLLALQLTALLFTLSLAGLVFVSLGVLLYIYNVTHSRRVKLGLIAGTAFLASILLAIPFLGVLADNPVAQAIVLERFSNQWGESSADTRAASLGLGVGLVKSSFLAGVGFGQVRVELGGIGLNNSALTMFAELGVMGIIIYILFALTIVSALLDCGNMERSQGHIDRKSSAALMSMFVCLSLHALLIDVTWTFINWLAISLIFMHRQVLLKANRTLLREV